jgi:RNA polymerase sigma factor (sigma-70 family)
MTGPAPAEILRHLAGDSAPDADLLGRFATTRDGAAFAELVRRHGPVVLAACRRGVRHHHDAEDAFQAVFLVLARRAGAIGRPEFLGSWLYRVAVRVTGHARRAAARRRGREVQAVDVPEPVAPTPAAPADIGPVLDEELGALPALYRDAVVLCDLRGVTRAEAAARLGIPLGTLASRLDGARKKLAARLVRRGVTLSVAGVLVEARAVAVPDSLLIKTCGLVADSAAGAVVPAAVLRLARGGSSMKSVLLGGALALALVAGVVVAGARTDTAPKSPATRGIADPLAAVAAVVPEPQEGGGTGPPKGTGVPKADVKFAAAPKLREALDLPVRDGRRVVWSPAGDRLVVVFSPEGGGGTGEALLVVRTDGPKGPHPFGSTGGHDPDRFAGFAPDGNELLLVRRESGLVSGRHQASFWVFGLVGRPGAAGLVGGQPGAEGGEDGVFTPAGRVLSLVPYEKRFDLDPEQSGDYAFAPDGKSYRTLVLTRDETDIRKVTVRRVSTETGKVLETVGTAEGMFRSAQLTADGRRVVTVSARDGEVVAHDPAGGGALWGVTPDLQTVAGSEPAYPLPLGLSRDGGRVLVSRGFGRPVLLDGATGKALPPLEGAELVDLFAGGTAFSADARLVAAPYHRVEKKEVARKGPLPQGSVTRGEARLGVWDTTTGRLVRSWPGRVTALAFHPTRPVLAVLEPNGAQTRLGLWDFAAQP